MRWLIHGRLLAVDTITVIPTVQANNRLVIYPVHGYVSGKDVAHVPANRGHTSTMARSSGPAPQEAS
jgi:hypothetical protein